jgi:hypothetical protein
VARVVGQSRPEFDEVPIRDFVPLFVERGAKARLRQMSEPIGSAPGELVGGLGARGEPGRRLG